MTQLFLHVTVLPIHCETDSSPVSCFAEEVGGDGQTFELNRAAKVDSRGSRSTTNILILLLTASGTWTFECRFLPVYLLVRCLFKN